jgi:flavin-dependent dehydrogenase
VPFVISSRDGYAESMNLRVDAAIVGGGPAGSIIARRLAGCGWRVMLIERGVPNRPKTCGHCLGPRALALLQQEGLLARVRSVAAGETRIVRIHGREGSALTAALPAARESGGLLTPRGALDQTLREAARDAGAETFQPASARVLEVRATKALLAVKQGPTTQHVECHLLIGADGLGSSVARAAGLVDPASAGRKYGFAFDVGDNGHSGDIIKRGVINMFLAPAGYLGAVRQDDGRVHFAALVGGADRFKSRNPRAFVHHVVQHHPRLSRLRFNGVANSFQPIAAGPMPWRPNDVARGSVALVGDAAGYIEPFTGEGMTWPSRARTRSLRASLLRRALHGITRPLTCMPGNGVTQCAVIIFAADSYLWRCSDHCSHIGCCAPALQRQLLRAGSFAEW